MDQIIKNQIQITIKTWYRESTQEWVAEANVVYDDLYTGSHRWTGKTEIEATRGLYASFGRIFLDLEEAITGND